MLHGISFEINEPGIYVIIGKNGAGKTTLFRALSGILPPYSGRILINGTVPHSDPGVRKSIGYLSHLDAMPEGFPVKDIISIFADIEGVDKKRIDDLVNFFGIEELMHLYTGQLSRGQMRKVSLLKSIMGDKCIYFMDEPTSGLDPKTAADIRSLLVKLSEEKIVMYSSHNLYEASEIGSSVLAIADGELKFFSDMDSIQEGQYDIGIRAEGVEKVFPDARKEGRYYVLELGSSDMVDGVIDRLRRSGIKIREIREMENRLKKFFE